MFFLHILNVKVKCVILEILDGNKQYNIYNLYRLFSDHRKKLADQVDVFFKLLAY